MLEKRKSGGGVPGFVVFLIVLIILVILGFAAWTIYSRLRARRLGLPPPPLNPFASRGSRSNYIYPSPAPGGIVGWVNDKVRAFKNRRYAGGAYETTSGAQGATRGRGPLDPDEAWDTRVGAEADAYGPGGYYEEQELGLNGPTAYGGGGYGPQEERGRSRSRDIDRRYDEETGRGPAQNPFGDGAERSDLSLRGVSPRPMEGGRERKGKGSLDESPTERRSIFREDM